MAKKFSHDDVDKFFEYGIDIPNRTIYLGSSTYNSDDKESGVDFLMAERFIKALHILDKSAPSNDKPITVIANNPGGCWYSGMAMYGAMKACQNVLIIKMYGHAMSMGSIIPQAADERHIDPYCRFMIHYGYDGSSGHSKIFAKHADEGKKMNHIMENIYLDQMLERDEDEATSGNENYLESILSDIVNKQNELEYPKPVKIKYKFANDPAKRREDIRIVLKKLLDYDTFLSAEETVALGLADKVIE